MVDKLIYLKIKRLLSEVLLFDWLFSLDKKFIWAAIVICLIHSGIFSGSIIGFFGVSRLRLEVAAASRNKKAIKVLRLRKDSNFLLTTLIWGNVAVNVLLTLLTNNVLYGLSSFLFSTIGITIFGEIVPQGYFSRNALKVGAFLYPFVRFYQFLLYPVSKPSALLLDKWLGGESMDMFKEDEMKILLQKHILSEHSDVDAIEGRGAVNFLTLDDIHLEHEGEVIDPQSIVSLPIEGTLPTFPNFKEKPKDNFLQEIHLSKKKWVIITDEAKEPLLVLDADNFLRSAVYEKKETNPYFYCHRPIVVRSKETTLGSVIQQFKVYAKHKEDDVIDHDLILYWTDNEKRVITGADILGRLLRGIVTVN